MFNIPGFTKEEHEALKEFAAYARERAAENYERLDNGYYRVIEEPRYAEKAVESFKGFCNSLKGIWQKEREDAREKGEGFKPGVKTLFFPKYLVYITLQIINHTH